MGHLGAVFYKILGESLGQFFLPLQEVFLHKFESKYFQSKGEFLSRVFKSDFLSFSSTISILVFSHKHLSYPLIIHPIRVLLCECLLVIKVFRSPRDLSLFFEEADKCVRSV